MVTELNWQSLKAVLAVFLQVVQVVFYKINFVCSSIFELYFMKKNSKLHFKKGARQILWKFHLNVD